jgi:GNAT superfamily N-acetyltransferase
MSYIIHQCKDFSAVSKLNEDIFMEELTEDDLEGSAWWMVSSKDGPVAFAGVHMHTKCYASLIRVGIEEEHRGHGLQRKLIRVRVRWAKKQKAKGVVTYTLADNIASSNNLIKEGFRLFEPLEPWDDEEEPVLYWLKELLT